MNIKKSVSTVLQPSVHCTSPWQPSYSIVVWNSLNKNETAQRERRHAAFLLNFSRKIRLTIKPRSSNNSTRIRGLIVLETIAQRDKLLFPPQIWKNYATQTAWPTVRDDVAIIRHRAYGASAIYSVKKSWSPSRDV